jgi:predicted CXXCH cytochrome family protein
MSARRWAATNLIVLAVALSLGMARPAMADMMPTGHEGFANDARICVVCHRAHTAGNPNLLRAGAGMCLTCHKGGAGADTDVASGLYVRPDAGRHVNPWGTVGGNLLAGGFSKMDINGDGLPETLAYPGTSQHDVGETKAPFGSSNGKSMKLECTSCHSIHHDFNYPNQYRMLNIAVGDNPGPLSVTWNGPWEGPAQVAPKGGTYMAYTETDFSVAVDVNDPAVVRPDLVDPAKGWTAMEYTRNYKAGLSAWCEGCHNVYSATTNGANVKIRHSVEVPLAVAANPSTLLHASYGDPSSDLPLNDRSGNGRTVDDTLSCMTCHRAHGTTASMAGMNAYASADRGTLPALNDSMLLRRDNRGVCVNCHHNLGNSSF